MVAVRDEMISGTQESHLGQYTNTISVQDKKKTVSKNIFFPFGKVL